MAERTPLYPFSRKDSQRLGEHEKWLDSYQENCACARRIELAIKDAYAANRLNEQCARKIIEIYGFDRVCWVLAHTIQHGENDTRFSKEQHSWAKEYNIPYDDHYLQRNFTVGLHPTLVATFADMVCKVWKSLGLYDKSHCYDESFEPRETESIKGEFIANGWMANDLKHTRGVISMARSDNPNSASSQFFIMHGDSPHLDGNYAAFGMVVSGMATVDGIANIRVAKSNPFSSEKSTPVNTVTIEKAEFVSYVGQ